MATGPDETRLLDLLVRWEELRRQGQEVTVVELCADYPELAAGLRKRLAFLRDMSALDAGSTDSFQTPPGNWPATTAAGQLPDALHATAVYEPRRRHAMGGQGEVLVAHHRELDRLVALKRVRPDRLHEQARRRFLREAAITARLQHPGIVPVYAIGQDQDGPFYTMPLVEGQTLSEAIAEFHGDEALKRDPGRRSLKFRGLLQRFVAVCETIAYAHDRGVTHRDLKPSNIILGAYGETLVMDWGLAKSHRGDDPGPKDDGDAPSPSPSPEALTATGAVMGTPRYMSPEQARGEPASPASDIFSLGLILYEILTGRPTFDPANVKNMDLLEAVRQVAIAPPRSHDASLPRALEVICLKALAADPEARYPSARALSSDLEKWLADEPVSAWRESWTRRLNRWVKRHRTGVTSAAAAGIVALVGMAIVSAVQTKARNDLDRKKDELTLANIHLTSTNEALNIQRERSEANETQAIDAVKRFGDVIAEEPLLKDTPELRDLRKRLLQGPLAFFRGLRERLQADRDTRPEALVQLAEAMHDYAHLTDEVGDQQDGLKAHEDSLAIWEGLTRDEPDNPRYQRGLATIHDCRGNFLWATGQPAGARRAYESALAIWRRLADDHPTVTQFQRDLAISHNDLGILLGATGQPAEARRAYEAALAIQRKLAEGHPTVTQYQRDLANSHNDLGILLGATGQPAEAREAFESALAIRRKLAEDHPTITQYQGELADSHNCLAYMLSATGQPAEARRSYEAALTIRRKLAEDHPEAPDFASGLGATLNNLALIDLDEKHFDKARADLQEAIAWQKKALATNPRNPQYRQFLSNHLTNLIKAAHGLGLDGETAGARRELDEFQASDPRFEALDARLGAVLNGEAPRDNAERLALARRAYDTKRHALAARLWAEAMDSDPKVADSRNPQHRYNAACAAALAADGQGKDDPAPDDATKLKLRQQALAWLKAELAVWAKFVESGPPQARASVAQTLAHWHKDTDLAGVREPGALERLPEDERDAWRALWAGVEDLLERAKAGGPGG
jgi:serine/threonine protein kinase/tetratricopeptide (TPR) repeat protein